MLDAGKEYAKDSEELEVQDGEGQYKTLYTPQEDRKA